MKYKVTLNGRTYEVEVEQGKAMLTDEYEAYAPAPAAPAAPAAAPAPAAKNNAKIAAIVAAVTMAMGSTELKFKAIERTGAPLLPWAAAGNGNLIGDRARLTEGGNK